MKILVQVHDIKDPLEYTVRFLNKLYLVLGGLDIVFLLPKRSQNKYKSLNIPFKHQFVFLSEYLNLDNSITTANNAVENSFIQQKVLEKLGVTTNIISLNRMAVEYKRLYSMFIDIFKPDLCICWNGQIHLDQTCFRDLIKERNIPAFFLERGLIPSSVFCDYEGVNVTSSPMNWDEKDIKGTEYSTYYKDILNYVSQKGVAIVSLNQKATVFKKPYILFPLQRDSDSNLVINSPYFKNMYSILKELNDINLPLEMHYRFHPEDPKTHYTKNLKFDNEYLLDRSDFDLEQHIDDSRIIMTVNSTIGFSALLKDKKVITLGNSIYSHKGFTVDYGNFDSIGKAIDFALNKEFDASEIMLKNDFVSKLIMKHHVIFDESRMSFEQTNELKKMVNWLLG